MNRDLLVFALALLVAGLIGGFVGAEWTGSSFSPTGAVLAAAITAAVLLGVGAFFTRRDQAKRKPLPPEIRGVFDRMLGGYPEQPPNKQTDTNSPGVQAAVRASLERKKNAIDRGKVQKFTMVMQRLGGTTATPDSEEFARIKLLMQPDPVIAALSAQRELLNMILDRSRGDPKLMGQQIANRCLSLCELVNEGVVSKTLGREYFDAYIKVFERVHGIKMPFVGGPLDFDTSLEIAREMKKGDSAPR